MSNGIAPNPLVDISKVYMDQIAESDQQESYTVTAADKKANTPAWQGYVKGKKNVKTGEPLYKPADHLKTQAKEAYAQVYSEKAQSPGQKLAKMEKDDDAFGSPESKKFIKGAPRSEPWASPKKLVKGSKGETKLKAEDKDWGYDKEGNSLNPADIEKKKRKEDKLFGSPKVKKESVSNWRDDLKGLIEIVAEPEEKAEKEIKEKSNIKNKVIINPKLGEAIEEMGGELLSEKDKDTPDQVKAVIAYDKARKGTRDAVYDTEHGDKKQAKKERDYAKWQRDKGAEDAQKSGHPWKHAKYSTREKEGKKSEKHAHIKDSYDRESQLWDEVAERLTELHEIGGVQFKVVPLDEGQLKQELKDLKKGVKTLKGKNIAKADKVEEGIVKESGWHRRNPEKVGTPEDPDYQVLKGSGKVKDIKDSKPSTTGPASKKPPGIYKPDKDGKMVRVEDKNWIQGAVKRPGAFTKKAKAAGMSVQQFAKHVDDNKSKYSTRTERQANLAQTFAKIRKEQAEKKSL